jgi:DNA-binding NarL/FixJ family response regulator
MTNTNMMAAPPIPGARVLIVDDELQLRSTLVRSLSLLGYQADEASSGHQALEMLEDTPCDVMVLDAASSVPPRVSLRRGSPLQHLCGRMWMNEDCQARNWRYWGAGGCLLLAYDATSHSDVPSLLRRAQRDLRPLLSQFVAYEEAREVVDILLERTKSWRQKRKMPA